jgi:hypothetical protein
MRYLLCLVSFVVLYPFEAAAQQRDCRAIADPAERLKCFDQPVDCKTITDSAARLKCFDAQGPGGAPAPAATPAAPTAAPIAAPAPAPAPAARILKAEPPGGQLPHGARVWIDDGSCPAGFIKQVIGGDVSLGLARERSCVPRP